MAHFNFEKISTGAAGLNTELYQASNFDVFNLSGTTASLVTSFTVDFKGCTTAALISEAGVQGMQDGDNPTSLSISVSVSPSMTVTELFASPTSYIKAYILESTVPLGAGVVVNLTYTVPFSAMAGGMVFGTLSDTLIGLL